MTRNRAGLESRLGEISAEAQELRVRLSDLENAGGRPRGGALGDPGPVERAGGGQPTAGRGAGPGLDVGERAPRRAGGARGRVPGAGEGDRRARRRDRRAGRAHGPGPAAGGRSRSSPGRDRVDPGPLGRIGSGQSTAGRGAGPRRGPGERTPRRLDEREAACQEQARVIAGATRGRRADRAHGPGRSFGRGAGGSSGRDRSRSGAASTRSRATIGGWARSGTAPRPWRASSAPGWTSATPSLRHWDLDWRICSRHGKGERLDPGCQRDGQPSRGANRRTHRADRWACGRVRARWDPAREVARPRCSRFEISSPRGKTKSRPWSLAWAERSITWGWSDGSEPTCAVSSHRPPGSW